MIEDGFYGKVEVPLKIFNQLNPKFFISHSNNIVKYMCANIPEDQHLKSLKIDTNVVCDWFKIVLKK